MLTIRLSRVGKKKQPTYRFIVSEKSKDPWGDNLEILGHFNPRTNPATLVIKADRVKHWISKGATTSDTVHNLLVDQKIIEDDKRRIVKISQKRKAVAAEANAKQAESAEKAAAKAAEKAAEKPVETVAEEAPATPEAETVQETEKESTPGAE